MNELTVKAMLAGVAFGIWPLLMSKSGLKGNVSSFALTAIALVVLLPFAYRGIGEALATANWVTWAFAIGASTVAAFGLLPFNDMLAKAPTERLGTLFCTMIVVQIIFPAVHKIVSDGRLTSAKGMGFVAAIVAAYLLNK